MLTLAVPAVEQVPQLGPLVLRVPLPELVAEGVHALLGPRLVLVAATAAEHGVEAVLLDRVEERDALQAVADRLRARVLGHPPGVDRRLDRADDELGAQLGDAAVPVVEDLVEVVAGVDVHQREGEPGRPEGLLGDLEHHRGVLAAGEEEHRVLELGRDLAEDVDRLGLERVEVRDRRFRHPATSASVRTRHWDAAIVAGRPIAPGSAVPLPLTGRVDDQIRQLRPADQQIGQVRVGFVVAQRRPVEAGGVEPGGPGHGDRRRRVPLVLAAGVGVDVGVAEDDRHGLRPGRAHRDELGAERGLDPRR